MEGLLADSWSGLKINYILINSRTVLNSSGVMILVPLCKTHHCLRAGVFRLSCKWTDENICSSACAMYNHSSLLSSMKEDMDNTLMYIMLLSNKIIYKYKYRSKPKLTYLGKKYYISKIFPNASPNLHNTHTHTHGQGQ